MLQTADWTQTFLPNPQEFGLHQKLTVHPSGADTECAQILGGTLEHRRDPGKFPPLCKPTLPFTMGLLVAAPIGNGHSVSNRRNITGYDIVLWGVKGIR